MPRSIPAEIDLTRSNRAAAGIAEGLLEAGVLQESDWQGSLALSIASGLARWVNEEMGCRDLDLLNLTMGFSDDAATVGLEYAERWVVQHGGTADRPVGFFGIDADRFTEVFVGARVLRLEAKETGLGYAVLALINEALWTTIGAATCAWAAEETYRHAEWWSDEEIAEDEELLTLERFHKDVPQAACKWRTDAEDRRLVKRALRRSSGPAMEEDPERRKEAAWVRQVASAAQGLFAALDAAGDVADQLYDLLDDENVGMRSVLTLGVRWSEDDGVRRIVDDYHELLAQSDSESRILWVRGFQLGEGGEATGSLADAIRALRSVIAILVLVDRLVALLDSEEPVFFPAAPRVRVRAGAPLTEVFAAEEGGEEYAPGIVGAERREEETDLWRL